MLIIGVYMLGLLLNIGGFQIDPDLNLLIIHDPDLKRLCLIDPHDA